MHSRYIDIVRLLIDAAPFVFIQECFAMKSNSKKYRVMVESLEEVLSIPSQHS